MLYILLTLLILPLLLLFHSYVIFPAMMINLSRKDERKIKDLERHPSVAVLMSVYNEEEVIEGKLESMINTLYLPEKLQIWVGSDASTDKTDEIIKDYSGKYENLHFVRFNDRTGKPQIINYLAEQAQADVFILTDADTMFYPQTIPNLIRYFRDQEIGGVQASLLTEGDHNEQVSIQEVNYNEREFKMKHGEGIKGAVIGAFGACYAIRKELYEPVPKGFYVDDFFIFMNVLSRGFKTVFAPEAKCTMKVSGHSEVQFRRKVRISKGNFQNLLYFLPLVNPFKSFASFAFFSHKVIRWCGPFLMLLMLLSNLLLVTYHPFFKWLLILQVIFYCLGFIDLGFRKLKWHIKPLRFISHFVMMNTALLVGFIRFLLTPGDGKWDNRGG